MLRSSAAMQDCLDRSLGWVTRRCSDLKRTRIALLMSFFPTPRRGRRSGPSRRMEARTVQLAMGVPGLVLSNSIGRARGFG